MYQEIEGDLIALALEGQFDVIAHGCNCFCTMGAGIAVAMKNAFGCDKYPLESIDYRGDINKLGQIETVSFKLINGKVYPMLMPRIEPAHLMVVNCYTQYHYGRTKENSTLLDYEALILCLKKMNHEFRGKHIGLPRIGCNLAGGSWSIVSKLIKAHLADCRVTIVNLPS